MDPITLKAHFDGKQILLDEPIELQPGAKLMITVLSPSDIDHDDWSRHSMHLLSEAYGSDEPEYSRSLIKEVNPEYEGG
jgi:hypothetical protein